MAERLTRRQRAAIDLLKRCDSYDDGWGVLTTAAGSTTIDGQAWINWRTAYSLRDRGLVEILILSSEDGAIVRLLDRPENREARA